MTDAFNLLKHLTSERLTPEQRETRVNDFAIMLDWMPSYQIDTKNLITAASRHLVVEHGLETAAVITFLDPGTSLSELPETKIKDIFTVSYNNLVDAHILIDDKQAHFYNNRADNPLVSRVHFSPSTVGQLSSRAASAEFQKFSGSIRYSKCEDALIHAVTRTKRQVISSLGNVGNSAISAFLNAVILIRACEDHNAVHKTRELRSLRDLVFARDGAQLDVVSLVYQCWDQFGFSANIAQVVDMESMNVLRELQAWELQNLINDFYRNALSPCSFNFDIMSTHALSRIYERYVGVFRIDEESDKQGHFWQKSNIEEENSDRAAIYTPQYIATFFARFVADAVAPRQLRNFRVVDPACGSGIFIRTWLEQMLLKQTSISSTFISDQIDKIFGVDKDYNAISAAKLSLSLLHLNKTGDVPVIKSLYHGNSFKLEIFNQDNEFDVFLGNPPFEPWDLVPQEDREMISDFLEDFKIGKSDSYLGFVKLALERVRENGFVCLVLPHNFLLAENAALFRKAIGEKFLVHAVVDLSQVSVFDGVGAYVMLLVIQKRGDRTLESDAMVARCKAFEGEALSAVLSGSSESNEFFETFPISQSAFANSTWQIKSPIEARIATRLSKELTVGDVFDVNQGFISGANDVFIRDKKSVPLKERDVYMDYLPDKSMTRYGVPKDTALCVFYPYVSEKALEAEEIEKRFPDTWAHLLRHKDKLASRKGIKPNQWWRPTRSRIPSVIRRPKIVAPHLILGPKFSLDLDGRYAVSHTPFVSRSIVKSPVLEDELLQEGGSEFEDLSPLESVLKVYVAHSRRNMSRIMATRMKATAVW